MSAQFFKQQDKLLQLVIIGKAQCDRAFTFRITQKFYGCREVALQILAKEVILAARGRCRHAFFVYRRLFTPFHRLLYLFRKLFHTPSFKAPFPRVTMAESIREHTGIDIEALDEDGLRAAAKAIGVEVDQTMGKGKIIDEIFGEKCEGLYIQPTFITDYPVEMSPLTKRHRSKPELTERFELMVNGKELCNAYSELNDPIDQYERFVEQMRLGQKGDDEAMVIDADFVRALEYGMPPTSGMGIGMDRLVMLMTGQTAIQEVLLFPQMRPEVKAKTAESDNAEQIQS